MSKGVAVKMSVRTIDWIIIPLRFFTKWNLRIGSVRPSVSASVRPSVPRQISETTGWISLILGMMKDLYPPSMPVILEF